MHDISKMVDNFWNQSMSIDSKALWALVEANICLKTVDESVKVKTAKSPNFAQNQVFNSNFEFFQDGKWTNVN